jgi:hypothetical protein
VTALAGAKGGIEFERALDEAVLEIGVIGGILVAAGEHELCCGCEREKLVHGDPLLAGKLPEPWSNHQPEIDERA